MHTHKCIFHLKHNPAFLKSSESKWVVSRQAYGIIAGMKKDHARLEAALEHALAETHDAIAAREKLARDVVLARAGIAISAQDASPSLLDEKPAPKRAVDAVDKIVEQALAREAALRTPTTSAKPRGESPQVRRGRMDKPLQISVACIHTRKHTKYVCVCVCVCVCVQTSERIKHET